MHIKNSTVVILDQLSRSKPRPTRNEAKFARSITRHSREPFNSAAIEQTVDKTLAVKPALSGKLLDRAPNWKRASPTEIHGQLNWLCGMWGRLYPAPRHDVYTFVLLGTEGEL